MNSIPEKFKPIFWDTSFEELDMEKNKLYIISRMYCYGGMEGIWWVEHFYPEEDLIEAAKKQRDLNPIVANHLKNKFNLDKSDMKYYTMSVDWRADVFRNS